MPRPTAAQLSYGSATVILTTLAMLLLSGVTSVVGIAVIALVALCLGLLVSLLAVRRPTVEHPAPASGTERATNPVATVADPASSPSAAQSRVPASSLRR